MAALLDLHPEHQLTSRCAAEVSRRALATRPTAMAPAGSSRPSADVAEVDRAIGRSGRRCKLKLVAAADRGRRRRRTPASPVPMPGSPKTTTRVAALTADPREVGARRRTWSLVTTPRLVAAGLGAGDLNVAQAQVIIHALVSCPPTGEPAEVRPDAEAHLVAQAAEFGPRELRVAWARAILDIVEPDQRSVDAARGRAAGRGGARRAERSDQPESAAARRRHHPDHINMPDASAARDAGKVPRGVHLTPTRMRAGKRQTGSFDWRPQARTGVLRAAGGRRPQAAACARR